MCRIKSYIQHVTVIISVGGMLSACASNVIDVHSKDSSTFSTLETSFSVSNNDSIRMKLRTSQVDGKYTQTIPSGKMIIIDGDQIHGEVNVAGVTELSYTSISFGGDDLFSGAGEDVKVPRASFYLGLAQTNMDVTLVHGNQSYVFVDNTIELYLQIGALYPVSPLLGVGVGYAMSAGADLTGISELDLKLDYALYKHLHLTAGYRWLEYNYLVEEQDSSIRVGFRGPFLGLDIPF